MTSTLLSLLLLNCSISCKELFSTPPYMTEVSFRQGSYLDNLVWNMYLFMYKLNFQISMITYAFSITGK